MEENWEDGRVGKMKLGCIVGEKSKFKKMKTSNTKNTEIKCEQWGLFKSTSHTGVGRFKSTTHTRVGGFNSTTHIYSESKAE